MAELRLAVLRQWPSYDNGQAATMAEPTAFGHPSSVGTKRSFNANPMVQRLWPMAAMLAHGGSEGSVRNHSCRAAAMAEIQQVELRQWPSYDNGQATTMAEPTAFRHPSSVGTKRSFVVSLGGKGCTFAWPGARPQAVGLYPNMTRCLLRETYAGKGLYPSMARCLPAWSGVMSINLQAQTCRRSQRLPAQICTPQSSADLV
jgi:hypothetical protein